MRSKDKRHEDGFTLVELIVVIAIIGILSSIAVTRISAYAESSKAAADLASLKSLNTVTAIYGVSNSIETADVFTGISTDSQRMQALVDEKLLFALITPKQKNSSFEWNIQNQVWTIGNGIAAAALSPLGDTFHDISAGMISMIESRFALKGYGRNWGDYAFTDIGLKPSDWQSPINHIVYKPGGSQLAIRPEVGYTFTVADMNGKTKNLAESLKWNLVYSDLDKKWYYHTLDAANVIDINTLTIAKSK
jgi:prepilin-type N-terminal cleavage/methylation domain-containing protein